MLRGRAPSKKHACFLEGVAWNFSRLTPFGPRPKYGFAYGLNQETRQFSTNFSCEPHGEAKETYLCPRTDRVQFRLFPSAVWAGREYGLDWFRVRFHYPLR